jgi:hypothetical protein
MIAPFGQVCKRGTKVKGSRQSAFGWKLRHWRIFSLTSTANGVHLWRMRIVRTKRYIKDLKRIGASAAEISLLEGTVASDPMSGTVIPGLGGVRKMRFRLRGRGKRGGGRAIYFLMVSDDVAVMLFAFAKGDMEDITEEQRRAALAIMKEIKDG